MKTIRSGMIAFGSILSLSVTGQQGMRVASKNPETPNFIIIFADDMG
jgi:hypothetical protein